MSEISISATSTVDERPAKFSALDGTALTGTWFEPSPPRIATTVVVIVCGAGIPARFYHHFARYLCECGAAVLTFDYRGIGVSRQGNLRKLKSGMEDWAVLDIPAAFAEARARYRRLPLGAVAHSVGTLLLGAAPDASRIKRLIFFGPHTGYWRDYGARVGIWRLIDTFDRFGVRASVLLNSDVCRLYPQIIEAGRRRKWAWLAHGKNNSILHADMTPTEERRFLTDVVETIAEATGGRPHGWMGPGLTETFETPTWRMIPRSTWSLMAPTLSSTGTFGSGLCR